MSYVQIYKEKSWVGNSSTLMGVWMGMGVILQKNYFS